MGAELFPMDGRTDRRTERHDEANSRFSQYCGRAKMVLEYVYYYSYDLSSNTYIYKYVF